MGSKQHPDKTKMLTLRAALVLLFALIFAAGAGALAYVSDRDPARACIVGISGFAGAVLFLNKIIQD